MERVRVATAKNGGPKALTSSMGARRRRIPQKVRQQKSGSVYSTEKKGEAGPTAKIVAASPASFGDCRMSAPRLQQNGK